MEILLLVAWLIRTVKSLSTATYYWQLKEYRWDRMKDFLFSQKSSEFFFSSFHLLLALSLGIFLFGRFMVPSDSSFFEWFSLFVFILFLAEALESFHLLLRRQLKRPRLTFKALFILAVSFGLELLILYVALFVLQSDREAHSVALFLAILSVLELDINALVVLSLGPVTQFFRRRVYNKARAKRLARKDLKVIGITGSFGKTSVKECLSHLLEKDFEVLKTAKNTNTEIGIANTILKRLKPKHQVFVCEMGAYKRGEIKVCSYIARPDIGIFTGLNEQHVALFGSIENTFKAKWDLIASLPKDGLAVFNGDSEELLKRLKHHDGKSVVCTTGKELKEFSDHQVSGAQKLKIKPGSVSFEYKGQAFEAPLIGAFQVQIMLMAITVAEELGMSLSNIAKRVKTLKAPEKTMELKKIKKGSLLDDSYNVNPDGLRAALEHLKLFKDHQKVLFFPGILELGEESEAIHQSLGEDIGEVVDYAFFTDPSFSEPLIKGVLRSGLTRNHIFEEQDQGKLLEQLNKLFADHPDQEFVILFESRGAEKVMLQLLRKS